MEILRGSLLPRRLTQMYTDTKRSYEQIVQTNITNPQLSSLHLKLRIQKDRLIAWGLEWADSNAGQSDDIDSSLDRAGISDLVASIMSSIRELLDEAERIQPQSRPQLPGSYPVDKAIHLTTNTQWTPGNLARLEDIVRDITTSIDTLCDLSRSQQMMHQGSGLQTQKRASIPYRTEKLPYNASPSAPKNAAIGKGDPLLSQSSLISSSRIDPNHVIYPSKPQLPAATPPSYNSTATDPGNRVFAFLRSPEHLEKGLNESRQKHDTPVLIDYYSENNITPRRRPLSSLQRFEDLVRSLQGFPRRFEYTYTGSLKILGWFVDPGKPLYAFVYELPQLSLVENPSLPRSIPPCSLLSYLQNSGDTDSSNVPCLEDRFRLALNLISNLLHVHAKGLTHRNINSNNVVFVNQNVSKGSEHKPWKEGVIRKPFLVSWDQHVKDTSASEPETLISNIYRHPAIERGQRSSYRPAHDIYSLGLVLLEIGLWMPLNKLWKTKYARIDFKARLQAIYAKKLAAKCGSAYMNAVEHCLRAADEEYAPGAPSHLAPRDQQAKSQNEYYWEVFKPLERCCVMDGSDEPRIVATVPASEMHHDTTGTGLGSDENGHSVKQTTTLTSKSTTENQAHRMETTIDLPQEHQPEQPKPRFEKGYSPAHPGGIDLPVWTYGADQESWEYYDKVLGPKIAFLAWKAIDKSESWEISVFMSGPTRELAKPTILFVCKKKSFPVAWKILDYVNKDQNMFNVFVCPGQLRWSKGKKKKAKKIKKTVGEEDQAGQKPSRYQQKPACGASIGCFVDEQHSEAVTFGGVVLVDGEPYGMTVHHVLEDPDNGQDADDVEDQDSDDIWDFGHPSDGRHGNVPGFAFDTMLAGFDAPESLADGFGVLENMPDCFDALEILEAEAESEKTGHSKNLLAFKPGQAEVPIVTQPALDDVDSAFFIDEDEMSDDHLQLHGLGTIHASSGLRQLRHGKVAHEIDWALFRMHDDRKPTVNAVEGGDRHCESASGGTYPHRVLKADALSCLKVHAFGSTSGLETGEIMPVMERTFMPGRTFPSKVWRFTGNFGVGGDSGAWIMDNETGAVCGLVSSWSESRQTGVLIPIETQLLDIEQCLGVQVALPSGEEDSFCSYKEQFVKKREPNGIARWVDKVVENTSNSDYGSDSEPEEDTIVQFPSPELATSPPSSSSRNMSGPEPLSLNDVADKWETAQASRLKGNAKDGKIRGNVHVRERIDARC